MLNKTDAILPIEVVSVSSPVIVVVPDFDKEFFWRDLGYYRNHRYIIGQLSEFRDVSKNQDRFQVAGILNPVSLSIVEMFRNFVEFQTFNIKNTTKLRKELPNALPVDFTLYPYAHNVEYSDLVTM